MTFTTQYLLTSVAGRRPRVPGAVVIIADKKATDNLTLPAINLRATGVLQQTNEQLLSYNQWNKILGKIVFVN